MLHRRVVLALHVRQALGWPRRGINGGINGGIGGADATLARIRTRSVLRRAADWTDWTD
jgi:hypothetical protein